MNRKPTLLALLLLAAAILPAQAAIIVVPPGLNVGDKYRLVFVTDGTGDAGTPFIATYNAFVSAEAAAVPALLALGTTWTAIGSTPFDDAQDNTGTNPLFNGTGLPIYGLDGMKVADNNADLWDGLIDAPIVTTPTGATLMGAEVWTGTDVSGTGVPDAELGAATLVSEVGLSGSTGSGWIDAFDGAQGDLRRFYAISGELTVVPEPSRGITLLIGLACVVLRRRRT